MTEKKEKTEEVAADNAAMNLMTDNEMNSILSQLVGSKFWDAILRYNRVVDANTLNSLASLDPFKEPTLVARSQGLRMGIYHLEQTAARECEERKKLETESGK